MSGMVGFALLIGAFAFLVGGAVGYVDCLNSGYSEFQCLCVALMGVVGFLFWFGLSLYEMFFVGD